MVMSSCPCCAGSRSEGNSWYLQVDCRREGWSATGWLWEPRFVPVPVRPHRVWLPPAFSVMVREAVRAPVAEGVKVTFIVQLAPPATELPQVVVCAKLLALVPVTARLVIVKTALPVLLSVTDCSELVVPTPWLPKGRLSVTD